MGYVLVKNGQTEFAIDWDFIHRLLRSYYTAVLQYNYAKEVTISESRWYNPFSYSLPDVKYVDVDWPAVRRDAQTAADNQLTVLRRQAAYNARDVAYTCSYYIDETARCKELFVDWMGDLQTENTERVNKAVDSYESKIEVARFFRDRSADGLMVGASLLSGGAALAVLGGGSILKGTGKFQDTGSVGAGVMEGAGSFAFAYVKLGKTFTFRQDMVLALIQAPYTTATELVGGDSLGKAALSGALKLTGPGVERLLKVGADKTAFDRVALPFSITASHNGKVTNVTGEFAIKYTSEVVQNYGVETWAKDRIIKPAAPPSAAPPKPTPTPQRSGALLDQTTLSDKTWLKWAIVNQEKGIGWGW